MTAPRKTRLSPATLKLVRSLAVEYSAYNAAREANDDLGVSVWGKMLLETQEALTGVALVDPNITGPCIAAARRRLDAADQKAA